MVNTSNHVVWRWYLSGTLKTAAPLILGSGENDAADVQCIRDGDGRFFIPGTTLAGILRHTLFEKRAGDDIVSRAFGEAKDDGRQSLLLFHDAPLSSEEQRFAVRDGVALDRTTKTAEDKKKFDYEIIERGQVFAFRMEAIMRERDIAEGKLESMKELLEDILRTLTCGSMRIGAKRSRGFGKIVLESPRSAVFDFSNPAKRKDEGERWLHFKWSDEQLAPLDKLSSEAFPGHFSVRAGFAIPGAVFVRSYSVDPKAPDAVHITSGGANVIPGTSWAGVLRHGLFNLGRAMGVSDRMDTLSRSLFGEVEEGENGAFASNIIVDESEIKDARSLEYTRNKIDRFTGGVTPSALFTEKPSLGGNVELSLFVRKKFFKKNPVSAGEVPSPEACIGALFLALLDIGNGILPVGGAASVGRGTLSLRELFLDKKNMLEEAGTGVRLDKGSAGFYLRAAGEYLGGKRS